MYESSVRIYVYNEAMDYDEKLCLRFGLAMYRKTVQILVRYMINDITRNFRTT